MRYDHWSRCLVLRFHAKARPGLIRRARARGRRGVLIQAEQLFSSHLFKYAIAVKSIDLL